MAEQRKITRVIPGDDVLDHHVLHDSENAEERHVAHPVSPPSMNTRDTVSSRLHNSCPHLESSPRYHIKDNLNISFQSLKQQEFSADVFMNHILQDKEYSNGHVEADPVHRYHLKDNYVPKVVPISPPPSTQKKLPSAPTKLQSRRHSEPIPREENTIGMKTDSEQGTLLQTKTTSTRHLKDGFIPVVLPEHHQQPPLQNKESYLPESIKVDLKSIDDLPVIVAAKNPPTEGQHHTRPQHHKNRNGPNELHKESRNMAQDNSNLQGGSSPPSKNRQYRKEQVLPDSSGAGTGQQHSRRHSEPSPSKLMVMVGPLPFLSQDRRDGDASTVSLADSQDCASLGSLSYAAHLLNPPLLKEQKEKYQGKKKGKEQFDEAQMEKKTEKRHFRRHSEPIFVVDPLPDTSQDRLDDASTRSVANSKDCHSLGSLSSALFVDERKERRCTVHPPDGHKKNTETKPKRHFRHQDKPIPPPSVIVKPLPVMPQYRIVDDSSTRSVADSLDWASMGSLSYAGHLQKPPLLEEQKEKQHHHEHRYLQHRGSPKQPTVGQGTLKSSVPVVPSFPDVPVNAPVMDDTSTRSQVDSQDCASLGSLSYNEDEILRKKNTRDQEEPHAESPFLSKMNQDPGWPNP